MMQLGGFNREDNSAGRLVGVPFWATSHDEEWSISAEDDQSIYAGLGALSALLARGVQPLNQNDDQEQGREAYQEWYRLTKDRQPPIDPLMSADFRVGLTYMEETAQWLAVDSLVRRHGVGDSCAGAVQDLMVVLTEGRDLLRSYNAGLTPHLRRELDVLDASVRPEML